MPDPDVFALDAAALAQVAVVGVGDAVLAAQRGVGVRTVARALAGRLTAVRHHAVHVPRARRLFARF